MSPELLSQALDLLHAAGLAVEKDGRWYLHPHARRLEKAGTVSSFRSACGGFTIDRHRGPPDILLVNLHGCARGQVEYIQETEGGWHLLSLEPFDGEGLPGFPAQCRGLCDVEAAACFVLAGTARAEN